MIGRDGGHKEGVEKVEADAPPESQRFSVYSDQREVEDAVRSTLRETDSELSQIRRVNRRLVLLGEQLEDIELLQKAILESSDRLFLEKDFFNRGGAAGAGASEGMSGLAPGKKEEQGGLSPGTAIGIGAGAAGTAYGLSKLRGALPRLLRGAAKGGLVVGGATATYQGLSFLDKQQWFQDLQAWQKKKMMEWFPSLKDEDFKKYPNLKEEENPAPPVETQKEKPKESPNLRPKSTKNIRFETTQTIHFKAGRIRFESTNIQGLVRDFPTSTQSPQGSVSPEGAFSPPAETTRPSENRDELIRKGLGGDGPTKVPSDQSGPPSSGPQSRAPWSSPIPQSGPRDQSKQPHDRFQSRPQTHFTPIPKGEEKPFTPIPKAGEKSEGQAKTLGEVFGRSSFTKELSNPEVKEKLMALTIAEVGQKNPAAQRALIETIMNRTQAHGTGSLSSTMNARYYQPFVDGGYQRALSALQNNPKLRAELEKRIQEVQAGSNDSNFGIHNSSRHVAASARRTQTVTAVVGGETFSTKDRDEFSRQHGIGTTRKEQAWRKQVNEGIARLNRDGAQRVETETSRQPPHASKESLVDERQAQVAAKRKLPIQETLKRQLNYAATQAGVKVEVTSGGQHSYGPNRTGGNRHDHGGAADLKLYRETADGRREYLRMDNPADRAVMQQFLTESVRAGATGIGAHPNYMGVYTMHVGGGPRAAWGYDWSSRTAPDWVTQSLKEGTEGSRTFNLAEWEKSQAKVAQQVEMPEQRPVSQRGITFGLMDRARAMGFTPKDFAIPKPPEQGDAGKFALPGIGEAKYNDATYVDKLPEIDPEYSGIDDLRDNNLQEPIAYPESSQETIPSFSPEPDSFIGDMHPDPEYNDPTKAPPIVPSDRKSMGKYDNHNVSGD
jgi:hypothetical protein